MLKSALDASPEDSQYLSGLIEAYLRSGQIVEARALFEGVEKRGISSLAMESMRPLLFSTSSTDIESEAGLGGVKGGRGRDRVRAVPPK